MQHEFEDHLLSAYLDDELSADERALVEQRLAVDPVARELLEDLKRLRGLVATLPAWQGADLQFTAPKEVDRNGDATTMQTARDASLAASDADGPERPGDLGGFDGQVVESSHSIRPVDASQLDARAKLRTNRSMRWTSIVALAAGIATLALGLQYLLQSDKPVSELAQHTSRAPEAERGRLGTTPAPDGKLRDLNRAEESAPSWGDSQLATPDASGFGAAAREPVRGDTDEGSAAKNPSRQVVPNRRGASIPSFATTSSSRPCSCSTAGTR